MPRSLLDPASSAAVPGRRGVYQMRLPVPAGRLSPVPAAAAPGSPPVVARFPVMGKILRVATRRIFPVNSILVPLGMALRVRCRRLTGQGAGTFASAVAKPPPHLDQPKLSGIVL